ncbi:hypothetical protein BGW36DRAFT_354237 [Talaromyces proteolyticus]|uniref:Peptidase A1 domain-containing protein n=1 Tax=Talaromyces proteolyticus TaxID=1131652 RepID=A0AAD4L8H8_9EURO|nr:uncharacterized protein BGW36DRAFT_354237 [Talaromyces proteolyticus]KAH8705844.1 hypothetical protein BGW36DRAFT_354237 [Talaromyces proteolyticus]
MRIKNQAPYGAAISEGTPPKTSHSLANTSSYTIGFGTPRSNGRPQPNNSCTLGITRIQPCRQQSGFQTTTTTVYINDTVSFELASNKSTKGVPNFQVATLDTFYASFVLPAPQAGFLGLNRPCDLLGSTLVEIRSGYHASFINQLYERGLIPGRTISVYIGQDVPDIDNAMLLINGKDAAKKASTPSTVPMDTSQEINALGANPSRFHINVTSPVALTTSKGASNATSSRSSTPTTTYQTFSLSPTDSSA